MAKSMADKQLDAAYRAAGQYAGEQLWIYETSTDVWSRVVNMSDDIETKFFVDLFAKKGFTVDIENAVAFFVSKRSLTK